MGLIYMRLEYNVRERRQPRLIFLLLLIVLVLFFISIGLMLFYLIFEVRIIPTFLLIVYWGANPERLRAAYYLIIYILMISFPLLVLLF